MSIYGEVVDTDKLSDQFSQVFFRFFIPGLFFLLFTISMPAYFIVEILQEKEPSTSNVINLEMASDGSIKAFINESPSPNGVISFLSRILRFTGDQPAFFILLAIGIGIILDLLKFHGFAEWITNSRKSLINLKRLITEGLKIAVDKRKLSSKIYEYRVSNLAYQIDSLFVRVKFPDIDKKIENSRIYPYILNMSIFSLGLGLIFILLSLIFKRHIFTDISSQIINTPFSTLDIAFSIFLLALAFSIAVKFSLLSFSDNKSQWSIFFKQLVNGFSFLIGLSIVVLAIIQIVTQFDVTFDSKYLFPLLIGGFILFIGSKKVRREFEKLNKLTKSHIELAHVMLYDLDKESLNDFYASLEEEGLIEKLSTGDRKKFKCNGSEKSSFHWKVKESDMESSSEKNTRKQKDFPLINDPV